MKENTKKHIEAPLRQTYTSGFGQFLVYLDTYTQLLAGMAGRLLDQRTDQLRLKLGHVQALLQGILGQHHVVIDARLVDRYR